jgi:electron transfer flavoprotein alpha/beta subunit
VDETVLLSDRKLGGSDTWATGYALAGTLKHIGYHADRNDWIIMGGRQTTDGDTAHVPSQVAENIGIPQVTLAESVEISDGHATVRRIIEGGSMDLRMPLPCMLSIAPTASALRGRNMKSAVKLKKQITKNDRDRDVFKEDSTVFTLLSVDEVGLEEHLIGLGGSPTIVAAAPAVEKVSRDLATAADVDELVDIVEGWE